MTLRKVRGGDRLKTGQVNQLIDEFNSRADSRTGRRLDRNLLPANPIWAVNYTGSDLNMGEVAAVDSSPHVGNPWAIPSENVVLTLREIADGDEDNWIVAANFIPEGEGGWVYENGVCLARLEPEGSGSPPGDYLRAVVGEKWLERSNVGTGILLVDLEETCTAGEGEWALIRFAGPQTLGAGGISPGTPTTYVQKEGDGATGSASTYMRSDALFELRLRAGSGPAAGTEAESGLEQQHEDDKLGVIWEKDDGYILDVSGLVASVGDRGTVARGNHRHAFDGTAFAGTNITWDGTKFNASGGGPDPYDATP